MEVRSYYATTVEAALMLAKKELGADALLIQSTLASPEFSHLGKYEVVFAGELQPQKVQQPAAPPARTAIDIRRPASRELGIAELPGLGPIDLLRDQAPALRTPAFAELLARVAAGEPKKAPNVPQPPDRSIPCSPGLGAPGSFSPLVALIGPCSSGKTTTIMKLAVVHGILVSRPIRLLAMDPHRIGATVRLQSFAQLLALSFQEFEQAEELSRALEFPFDGLTLIDAAAPALSACLQVHPHVETQLVLRADRKTADNFRALQTFSSLSPSRLILTGLDETTDHSDLLSLIHRSSLPVSFLSSGERIPEDIEPAASDRLFALIGAHKSSKSRSAA